MLALYVEKRGDTGHWIVTTAFLFFLLCAPTFISRTPLLRYPHKSLLRTEKYLLLVDARHCKEARDIKKKYTWPCGCKRKSV
jgi:hypothetical protein